MMYIFHRRYADAYQGQRFIPLSHAEGFADKGRGHAMLLFDNLTAIALVI
jgi:hypothetical protein